MKKLLLLFALLLTVCGTAIAQTPALTLESEVGTIGTLDGREAMVVDLGGSIGKVAVATRNVGAEKASDTMARTTFGTSFKLGDANDPEKNGLTDGWHVPSKAEMEALQKNLTPNKNLHCVEWKVTDNATLYLPTWHSSSSTPHYGYYVTSDRVKEDDTWKCWIYFFNFYDSDNTFGGNYFEKDDEQETEGCAIRPFHKLSAPANKIYYTSSDGQIVTPNDQTAFGGAKIVSNEYDKERGMFRITFDGDVECIGEGAFGDCSNLVSINLPSGVTSIGEYAFGWCSSLTTINLPSGLKSIEGHAFHGCSSLTTINLPSGLKSIEGYAFYGCSSLTTINLPSGVTSIGEGAFWECSSLTTINLPSGVTSIGYGAFALCSSLTTINLPSGLTSIVGSAFQGCSSLTSVNIPSGVKSIERSTFKDCSNLVSINLPSGVTSIGEGAFNGCSSLTSIVLPNDLNYIGPLAFQNCSGLTFITLPAKLTEMGRCPFEGCTNLEYVLFLGTTPPSYPEQTVPTVPTYPFANSGTDIGGTTLLVPDDAVNTYEEAGYTNVSKSSTGPSEIKSTALNDIETAMMGVTLTQDDADIVATCQANIESTNDIIIILIEKNRALSVIYLQKVKDESLAIIDAILDECTGLLTSDEIEALKESKRKILEATDQNQVAAEMQVIWPTIEKINIKKDLQSHYDENSFNLKKYFVLIDNAQSWAEIENIIKEAMDALDKNPHFVIDDKRYFITQKEDYEYNHTAEYNGGDIYFQDGVRYESNSKNDLMFGEIEYTRALPEGVWQCWYEPFDVQVDTEKFDAAEVACISANAQNEMVVVFKKLEKGDVMQNNTIYVIRAKEGQGKLTVKSYRSSLHQSTGNQLTIQSAYENFTLTGNYSPVEHGEWYTLDGTGKFSKMSSGSLKPQRFYLTITPRKDQHYVEEHHNTKPFIDIMVLGDEETTGIEEASPKSSPASAELSTGSGKGVIYDLMGRKVTSIQKGQIYIVNGKKFIAR